MIQVTVGEQKTQKEIPIFKCPCLVDWDGDIVLFIKPSICFGRYMAYNFKTKIIVDSFDAYGAIPVTIYKGFITLQNIIP